MLHNNQAYINNDGERKAPILEKIFVGQSEHPEIESCSWENVSERFNTHPDLYPGRLRSARRALKELLIKHGERGVLFSKSYDSNSKRLKAFLKRLRYKVKQTTKVKEDDEKSSEKGAGIKSPKQQSNLVKMSFDNCCDEVGNSNQPSHSAEKVVRVISPSHCSSNLSTHVAVEHMLCDDLVVIELDLVEVGLLFEQ